MMSNPSSTRCSEIMLIINRQFQQTLSALGSELGLQPWRVSAVLAFQTARRQAVTLQHVRSRCQVTQCSPSNACCRSNSMHQASSFDNRRPTVRPGQHLVARTSVLQGHARTSPWEGLEATGSLMYLEVQPQSLAAGVRYPNAIVILPSWTVFEQLGLGSSYSSSRPGDATFTRKAWNVLVTANRACLSSGKSGEDVSAELQP
ncbi:hypothetical protein VTN00DRAFT_1281 [Thermoascus crustaceus]|uniref:uncharacterized protein n=1 Tax=Thermoascus crustaceus TaxID=5088 RepID=UPI003743F007